MIDCGSITDDKALQFEKEFTPMVVTEFGMFIDLRFMQFRNALLPIDLTVGGMTIDS